MAIRVLIVEDDPNISQLLQLYLEKEGFETLVAQDGGQGWSTFQAENPLPILIPDPVPKLFHLHLPLNQSQTFIRLGKFSMKTYSS